MNFGTISCSYKKRTELRASEDLRVISEQCTVFGRTNAYSLVTSNTVLQESSEDLSSLMYKMLVTEKDHTHRVACKTPLSAWQVCLSVKQHKGGYQIEPEKELPSSKRVAACSKNEHVFTPPRCHRNLGLTKESVDEKICIERDMVKDARAKSASCVDQSTLHTRDGAGKLYNLTRARSASPSPHQGYKFYHSKSAAYYIKSYREQITNDFIRKHIQWRLKENSRNNAKKSPKGAHETKSKALPVPSFTFYRFRISKNKNPCDSGYLKVGPCPRMSEQKEPKNAGVERYNPATSKNEQRKTQTNLVSTAAEKKTDLKEINSVTTLKFRNTPPSQRDNIVLSVDSEANTKDTNKTESSGCKLKKVELRVNSRAKDSPRIVPKTGRDNKTKGRVLGTCQKPTLSYYRSSSDISLKQKVTRKPNFGEKEFLRIATPKPLIHYQSQTPSDFDELPGLSPNKSSKISTSPSPVPSVSGTGLQSKVLAEILMKREPQVVFPKNSNFQACIYSIELLNKQCRNTFKKQKGHLTNRELSECSRGQKAE